MQIKSSFRNSLFTVIILLLVQNSYSQEKVFSPVGKMSFSQLTVDTVFNLHSNFNKSDIMFSKIDTAHIAEDTSLLGRLKPYLRSGNIDSIEYLYLFNPTNKPLQFTYRNIGNIKSLTAVEFAKKEPGKYLPITFILKRFVCGVGRMDPGYFTLAPNCLAVIKNNISLVSGNKRAFAKIRLLMTSEEKIISEPFITFIDYDAYLIPEKDGDWIYLWDHRDMISFLE